MGAEWTPRLTYDTQAFWQGCSRHEVVIARCADCRTWIHPPRGICPKCWSDNVGRETASGGGTVYSFTRHPASRRQDGKDRFTVWAELDEQPKLIFIADMDEGTTELDIGDRIEIAWSTFGGVDVPVFRKEEGK